MDTSLISTQTQSFRSHLHSAQHLPFHALWRVGSSALSESEACALGCSGDLAKQREAAPFRSGLISRQTTGRAGNVSLEHEHLWLSWVPP